MLVDSAELVGLRIVSMISENVGSVIAYAVDRLDEQDHFVLFINLGSTDLELSLFWLFVTEKNGKKVENIELLAEEYVRDVGGDLHDWVLVEIMVDHFNNLPKRKGKEDVRLNPKIMKWLFREVGKYKEILSSNKEVNIKLPELADELDLIMVITRDQYEAGIKESTEKVSDAIKWIISKSNLDPSSIHSYEITGGGLRVPLVRDKI